LKNCQALTVVNSGNVDVGGCVIPLASDSATNWASFGNMFAEGTQLYDKDWNVVLDQGENVDRATRFLDLYGELYKTMPPGMNAVGYAQLMSLFATGKTAHTLYSGRLVESLEATNPALADQYGIFASPGSSGQKALSYAFDGFCVFKTKQSEEAVKFLQWFVDEHYVDWLLSAWMNNHPSRLDIYENERWKSHPMIKKHWETMMQMKSFIEGDGVTITAIDTSGPSIDMRACNVFNANVMPEMLQQKVLGNTSSADCVAAAAQRIAPHLIADRAASAAPIVRPRDDSYGSGPANCCIVCRQYLSACIYYWRPVDLRGYAIILFVQFVYRRTSVGRLEQLQQGIARSSFWNSLTNGLIIAISSIVLQVVLGVGIAMVLNKRFLGRPLYARSLFFRTLPTVVACLVAQWILEPNYGLLKSALASIGVGMLD
jgi:ABC-type sugar transport system permease subunit